MRKASITLGVVLVLLGCRKKHAAGFQGAKELKCISTVHLPFQCAYDREKLTLTNWD